MYVCMYICMYIYVCWGGRVVAICSGKLSAEAKHIKHSKTQEGEVFRSQTLVLDEIGSGGGRCIMVSVRIRSSASMYYQHSRHA